MAPHQLVPLQLGEAYKHLSEVLVARGTYTGSGPVQYLPGQISKALYPINAVVASITTAFFYAAAPQGQ